jgi:hypothetical protein
MIDDLLDARDQLEALLDQVLPALEARPRAETAEMLAVLLVGPLRRAGPDTRLRRLVVRRLAQRGTPAAAAVLEAIAALADADTAARAAAAIETQPAAAIAGIGALALERGWTLEAQPPGAGLAAVVRRPGETGARLLKLWLEPGEGGGDDGLLAGGFTDPLDDRRLQRERERFVRAAGAPAGPELDAAEVAAELDRIVRSAAGLGVPLAEALALSIAQLRRAAGAPEWPDFDVQVSSDAPGLR